MPGIDGDLRIRNGPNLEQIFTASAATADFPQAAKHTQWPGTGRMGDPIADYFMKTQVEFIGGRQAQLTIDANVALLDMIGTPVILLTGRHGASGADSRVVGAVRRPAGVHELYRLMQQLLEDHPRSVARVPTHLRVSCTRDGKVWIASILSLSENGCLLRSREPLPLGTQLRLEFELPGQSRQGRVEIEAESAYQLLPDSGLVFSGLDPSERKRIQDFVLSAIFDA